MHHGTARFRGKCCRQCGLSGGRPAVYGDDPGPGRFELDVYKRQEEQQRHNDGAPRPAL